MKMRNDYVSNSSSSSFIVFGKEPPNGIGFIKLTNKQINSIHGMDNLEDKKIMWLCYNEDLVDRGVYYTEFISDGNAIHGDMLEDPFCYEVHLGDHGIPYDKRRYYDLGNNIFFPKTWDELNREGLMDKE